MAMSASPSSTKPDAQPTRLRARAAQPARVTATCANMRFAIDRCSAALCAPARAWPWHRPASRRPLGSSSRRRTAQARRRRLTRRAARRPGSVSSSLPIPGRSRPSRSRHRETTKGSSNATRPPAPRPSPSCP
jgi:hypothetical protein